MHKDELENRLEERRTEHEGAATAITKCDCEHAECDTHPPGGCSQQPKVRVWAFGMIENLCLFCLNLKDRQIDPLERKPEPKAYEQGYNSKTGDVLVVFTPEDIQKALDVSSETISEADARQLAEEYDNKIVDAMLYDWAVTLRDVLTDAAADLPRFPTDEHGNIIPNAGQDGSIA